jgi:hypothetical protein
LAEPHQFQILHFRALSLRENLLDFSLVLNPELGLEWLEQQRALRDEEILRPRLEDPHQFELLRVSNHRSYVESLLIILGDVSQSHEERGSRQVRYLGSVLGVW